MKHEIFIPFGTSATMHLVLSMTDCKPGIAAWSIAENGTGNHIDSYGDMRAALAMPPFDASKCTSHSKWTGLGDVIASATKAVGIKPCEPCRRRQEALNRMVPFGGNDNPGGAERRAGNRRGREERGDAT